MCAVAVGGCGAVDAVVCVWCCWIENSLGSLLLLFLSVAGVGGGVRVVMSFLLLLDVLLDVWLLVFAAVVLCACC